MGQYHVVVNLDKREYLRPYAFGDGAKLMEFGSSGAGTMLALAVLLSDSPDRGGGDLHTEDREWYGRWSGDAITIAGDYADGEPNVYDMCTGGSAFTDISERVWQVIHDARENIRKG
jgi:hypothetical protein